MRFDVGGKAQRVVARAFLGEFGVACFQRLDDRQMLGQRGRGAILPPDGQLPVAAHVQQDVVGHVDQHRRLRQRDQRLMEGDIGLGVFLDMILRQTVLAEILEEIAQRRDVLLARGGRDQARGHALERGPGADHVDDLGLGAADHDDAAARHGFDEAVLFQHRDGFANRGAADAEAFGQRALVEHHLLGRRIDVHLENSFLQGLIGLVLEARLRRNPDDCNISLSHDRRRLGLFSVRAQLVSSLVGDVFLAEETLEYFWHTKYQDVKMPVFSLFLRDSLS